MTTVGVIGLGKMGLPIARWPWPTELTASRASG